MISLDKGTFVSLSSTISNPNKNPACLTSPIYRLLSRPFNLPKIDSLNVATRLTMFSRSMISIFFNATAHDAGWPPYVETRSEERRVGKECRTRWWRDHLSKAGDDILG